jgi:hypothetical protein
MVTNGARAMLEQISCFDFATRYLISQPSTCKLVPFVSNAARVATQCDGSTEKETPRSSRG